MIGDVGVAFFHIVAPVLLIGGAGYVVGRTRTIDLSSITALAVSVLIPGITFDSLTRATVPRELLVRLFFHVMLQLVIIGALTLAVARILGWRGPSRAALLLATLFTNAGNTGLPIALFAFGQSGLAIAGGWFAIAAVTVHTIGIFIAAHARAGTRAALVRLGKLPITYAIVAGLIVKGFEVPVPSPIAKATELLASGSLAVLILLLGLQLARLTPGAEVRGATLATVIRLLVAPPVAWVTGRLIGLEGVALAVATLQASMPTAVTGALWAIEFDTRPALVSATVVFTTLAGIVTVTLLLAVLTG